MPARTSILSPARENNQHLASSWITGLALLFLGVGLSGAGRPFLPDTPPSSARHEPGEDLVMIEEFEAPVAENNPGPANTDPPMPAEEWEIPPLPEVIVPLTPPEMTELAPIEEFVERPKTTPSVVPKPKPAKLKLPPSRPAPGAGNQPPSSTGGPAAPGGTGSPSAGGTGGKGRFPQPAYPAAARKAKLQGSVQLTVTVESNGLPGTVRVLSSSGHVSLDAAARDQVQRRWRWPSASSGGVRRFTVPVRFVLK